MPRREPPRSPEQQAVEEFVSEVDQIAADLATEAGPPLDTDHVSVARKRRLWGQRDPDVNYTDLVSRLLTTGVPPEEAAQMILVQEHPELLPMFGQPMPDPETADALARLAEMPFRLGILAPLSPQERVREAESLDREWQIGQGAVVESAPMGVPPAVTLNVTPMQPQTVRPAVPPAVPPTQTMPADPMAMLGG